MSIDPNETPAGENCLARSFPVSEFQPRLSRAQAAMTEAGLDGLVMTEWPDDGA